MAHLTDEDPPGSQPPQQHAEPEDDRSWRNWIRSDDAVTIGVALAVSYGIRVCVTFTQMDLHRGPTVTACLKGSCSCQHTRVRSQLNAIATDNHRKKQS